MDVLGVSLGAVSLVTLFKTCLELFETFENGKNLGKDYEILSTKVGIERIRLALWGDSVGLTRLVPEQAKKSDQNDGVDPRLVEPRMVRAVSDILNCMRRLFEDSGSLTRRYGLQASTTTGVITASAGDNAVATTFHKTYVRIHASASRIQRGSSLVAAARWAIKDKKRFERFVEDLRGFNDSLALLFPDIDADARQAMADEIKESTDLNGLQIVEQAVSDLDGGESLVEAASVRITQLSQYTQSVAEDHTTQTDDSAVDIDVNRLTRQLGKLEASMSKRVELRGGLRFTLSAIVGHDYFAKFSFYGMDSKDWLVERHKEAQYVKHSTLAWSLMYMSDRDRHDQADFSRQDTECHRLYEGKLPGTRSIDGYIADFNTWIQNNNPKVERFFNTTGPLPDVPFEKLVERARRAQLQGDRFWNPGERSTNDDLEALIGPPHLGNRMQDEVTQLLSTLNRRRDFPDVLDGGSLATIALGASDSLYGFLLEMVLARELRMRMYRLSDMSFGNVSRRIVATMHASERWLDGVHVKMPDPKGKPNYVELHSLVHEQQVEGLVRFAETMAWPALGEMRIFAEEVYAGIRAGMTNTSTHLWDWLYGLMLPGNAFIFAIMAALVAATPSLQSLGAAQFYASGLVLKDRSYWRTKTVLGRVLGGMKGVRAANGWIGPCPAPVDVRDEAVKEGWWPVHARDVAFTRFMARDLPAIGDRFAPFLRREPREESSSAAEWIRSMGDRSEWAVPIGPSESSDHVEFRALRLQRIGWHSSSEPQQGTPEKDDQSEEPEPEQRATLEVLINDRPVSFTLYSNPVFIAAPACIDGPHAILQKDLPKIQHILGPSQLPDHVHTDTRVLIIDATGKGECELVARAWCSQNGQHAIVVRGQGTCFACAVKAASQGGLVIGCVIWSKS
ncbi:uncharacterized protein N7496_008977 [Penicillium cataractarum]|uniref:Prion-inhibition and propagation HeLo domain-containing protein n=1 Tax=Penicillium cataractarum TaxID=2100454 RepID=A0A9W9RZE8_9EURO|nr:uncharacterized protein N7496_008977 [Penicillium cataractarum]KAJ5369217.1 hypothetical protein N7496_008977 [Penicillium cataractarum]